MVLSQLSPAQRFMYEYGCFVSFWGNFEMYMEVVIWHLTNDDPIENCRKINPMTAEPKRKALCRLLREKDRQDVIDALDKVFDVAERNNWIHGVILNPAGDFSLLIRFRVPRDKTRSPIVTILDLDISPFDEFYQAYHEFEKIVGRSFSIDVSVCDDYIKKLQEDNGD